MPSSYSAARVKVSRRKCATWQHPSLLRLRGRWNRSMSQRRRRFCCGAASCRGDAPHPAFGVLSGNIVHRKLGTSFTLASEEAMPWRRGPMDERRRMIELYESGWTQSELADEFGLTWRCVHKWVKRHQEEPELGLVE